MRKHNINYQIFISRDKKYDNTRHNVLSHKHVYMFIGWAASIINNNYSI